MKNKFSKFIFVLAILGFFANLVAAENYPQHTDDYVNDFANVISAADEQQSNTA